jgi:hypothetical protein
MKKLAIFIVITLLSLSLTGVAVAKGKGKSDFKITGGGIAENFNSDFGVDLLTIGGFSAQGWEDGTAKGQVQAKSVLAADPLTEVMSIHGQVVCVEETVTEGWWEVRFLVTQATGPATGLLGGYGSLFVSDDGNPGAGNDFIDEGFAAPDEEGCGGLDAERSSPEPVLAGNFKIH